MRSLVLGLLLAVLTVNNGLATVWNSDGSSTSVQTIHATQAVDGDTITLPSGTFTWTTGVTISKAIKVQGAGSGRIIGRTLTANSVGTGSKTFTTQSGLPISGGQTLRIVRRIIQTDSGDVSGTFMLGTVTSYSGTTLVMNITSTGGSGTYPCWYIATEPLTTVNYTTVTGQAFVLSPATGNIELSGIKIIGPPSFGADGHALYINNGYPKEAIVHDCWFKAVSANMQMIKTATNSVLIYNCSFDSPFSVVEAIAVKWEDTAGQTSWTTVDTFGNRDTNGNKNFYIEDCDFHYYLNGTNFDSNARVVVRHCTFDNAGLGTHGADTSPEGMRHAEVYDNTFILEPTTNGVVLNVNYWFFIRGGTAVITNNVMPTIQSQDWAHKQSVEMIVENIRRSSGCGNNCSGAAPIGPYSCWTTYPVPHSPGQGNDGSSNVMRAGDITDPIRIWSNTSLVIGDVGLGTYNPDTCGNNLQPADFTQINRDYYFSTDATAARPGYVKYTYPHPLRVSPTPTPTASPTPTSTPTASPTATSTATPTATATPSATFTPTPTPSATPSATSTPTPSATPVSTPTAPTGIIVVSCSNLCLQWTPNPPLQNVTQYKIYRVRSHGADLVGTVNSPIVLFNVDAYLSSNRTKFYLTAVNLNGEGPPSGRVTVQRH